MVRAANNPTGWHPVALMEKLSTGRRPRARERSAQRGRACGVAHAPHPMQAPLSTTGKPSTMWIAFTGHFRAHAVHDTPSEMRMQWSFFQIACPMCVLALKARNHLYSSGRAHPVAPQAALADRRKRHDHCEQDYAGDLASVFCQSSRHCLSFCLVLLATYTPARMSAPPHTPDAVSASPRNATANATPMTGVR